MTTPTMTCRVCGRAMFPFDADGSINADHDLCDAIIRDASRPSLIPSGIGTRAWSSGEDERLQAEYRRRTEVTTAPTFERTTFWCEYHGIRHEKDAHAKMKHGEDWR